MPPPSCPQPVRTTNVSKETFGWRATPRWWPPQRWRQRQRREPGFSTSPDVVKLLRAEDGEREQATDELRVDMDMSASGLIVFEAAPHSLTPEAAVLVQSPNDIGWRVVDHERRDICVRCGGVMVDHGAVSQLSLAVEDELDDLVVEIEGSGP